MPIGIAFWVIMLIWLVFGLFGPMLGFAAALTATVSTVLLFVLFFLLGWKVFGFMFQG
jgi:hypothetical protein